MVFTGNLFDTFQVKKKSRSRYHTHIQRDRQSYIKRHNTTNNVQVPNEVTRGLLSPHEWRLRSGGNMGEWLTVTQSTVNGTKIKSKEGMYSPLLCCIVEPPQLPSFYNGCGMKLSIAHMLNCKKVRLVMTQHKKNVWRGHRPGQQLFHPLSHATKTTHLHR